MICLWYKLTSGFCNANRPKIFADREMERPDGGKPKTVRRHSGLYDGEGLAVVGEVGKAAASAGAALCAKPDRIQDLARLGASAQ